MPEQRSPYLYSSAAVLDSIPKPGQWKKVCDGNQRKYVLLDPLQQFLDNVVSQELRESHVAASPEVIEGVDENGLSDEEVADAISPKKETLTLLPPPGKRPRSGGGRWHQVQRSGAEKAGACARPQSARCGAHIGQCQASNLARPQTAPQGCGMHIGQCRASNLARPQTGSARLRQLGRAYGEDTNVPMETSPPSPRQQQPVSSCPSMASFKNIDDDPMFQNVAKRLLGALDVYFAKKPIKTHRSWGKFFGDMDEDESGLVTLEEFASAVQDNLGSPITRYELLVFWRRLDSDGSGQASLDEFEQFMHTIEVSQWPVLTPTELGRFIKKINQAADKWHRCAGNWFKVFHLLDPDARGDISFNELQYCIRGSFPNLRLSKSEVSDNEIQGFWKALAGVHDLTVTIPQFMKFLRHEGSQIGITSHDKAAHAAQKKNEFLSAAVKSADELRAILSRLEKAVFAYYKDRGFVLRTGAIAVAVLTDKDAGLMPRFFREFPVDQKNRLLCAQVRTVLESKFGAYLETAGVSTEDVMSFFAAMYTDCSGEMTRKQMLQYLYRQELDTWPRATETELEKVIGVMEHALAQRSISGGNWYSLFRSADVQRTNLIVFEDVVDMIRDCTIGLNIGPERVSESDIQSLWKSLDFNLSGNVTLTDFMIFMRMHSRREAIRRRSLHGHPTENTEIKETPQLQSGETRTRQDLQNIAKLLSSAMNSYLHRRGERAVKARDSWERFFEEVDLTRSSNLTLGLLTYHLQQTFSKTPHPPNSPLGVGSCPSSPRNSTKNKRLSQIVQTMSLPLGHTHIVNNVCHSDLYALWEFVDNACHHRTKVQDWCLCLHNFELESYPDLSISRIRSIVGIISKKTSKRVGAQTSKRVGARGSCAGLLQHIGFDSSARIGIEELVSIIRRPLPCLEINENEISEHELRGLWKAMDARRSGSISRVEFIIFMRRMGANRGENPKLDSARASSLAGSSSKRHESTQIAFPDEFWENLNADAFEEAYAGWGQEWEGYVTEWMWPKVAREILGIPKKIGDDALHAAWISWDVANDGRLPLESLLAENAGLQKMQGRSCQEGRPDGASKRVQSADRKSVV